MNNAQTPAATFFTSAWGMTTISASWPFMVAFTVAAKKLPKRSRKGSAPSFSASPFHQASASWLRFAISGKYRSSKPLTWALHSSRSVEISDRVKNGAHDVLHLGRAYELVHSGLVINVPGCKEGPLQATKQAINEAGQREGKQALTALLFPMAWL